MTGNRAVDRKDVLRAGDAHAYLSSVKTIPVILPSPLRRSDECDLDEALLLFSDGGLFPAPPMSSDALKPIPSMKGKEEPLNSAVRTRGVEALVEPIAVEIVKQKRLGALGVDVTLAVAVATSGDDPYVE